MSNSLNDLKEQATGLADTINTINIIHGQKSECWAAVHRYLSFGVAAVAGITAAGVVAGGDTWPTVLAVGSAILAAANVGFKPDDLRDRHKNAADRYGKLKHDIDVFVGKRLYKDPEDDAVFEALWDEYHGFAGKLAEIGEGTPNVARALVKVMKRPAG